MDTKSTSVRYSAWLKLLAVLLGLAGITVSFFGILRGNDFEYAIQGGNYLESGIFYNEVNNRIQPNILDLWNKKNLFENQEGYLSDEELMELAARAEEARQAEAYRQAEAEGQAQRRVEAARSAEEKRALARALMEEARQLEANAGGTDGTISAEAPGTYADQPEETGTEAAPVSSNPYQTSASNLDNAHEYMDILQMRRSLEGTEGLRYSVVAGAGVYGPSTDSYKDLPYSRSFRVSQGITAYMGFEENFMKTRTAEYEKKRQNGLGGIYMLAGGLLLSLLSMIWLMYTAGRSRRKEGVVLNHFDRIAFLDMSLCAAAALVFFSTALWANLFRGFYLTASNNTGYPNSYNMALLYTTSIFLLSAAYLFVLLYMTTLSKRFKRNEVIRHTALYNLYAFIRRFLRNMYNGFRSGLDAGPIMLKAIVFLVAYSLIGGGICLSILLSAQNPRGFLVSLFFYTAITFLAIWFLSIRLAGFKKLTDGVRTVRNGSLDFKIPLSGSHAIDRVIDDVNNLSAGLKAAVDSEMASERMKVELITNVSHDLRTPLTSIITYADLISAEDVTPEQVREYSGILKSKSGRLKLLVDDLFEVSKAQSGTMPLEFEALSLNDLLAQTMAEYQEGFENSRLEVKIHAPDEKVNIVADGSRMWRVLSNIFSNIVKYSMPGTRVYIDISSTGSKALVVFRNISASPMNFKAEEIFERFRRGDESRSGEGSGLGLAIAKSFMDVQNGSCSILIDGDLFKLTLEIPLAQPEQRIADKNLTGTEEVLL